MKSTHYHLSLGFLILTTISIANSLFGSETVSKPRLPRPHLQGTIKDDRYYSINNTFSIALPAKQETIVIEDFYASPTVGGVAFLNESGFFLKVEIDELIPEVSHLIGTYPEIKSEMLDVLFYDVLMAQLKIKVPGLHVLHERKIRLSNGEDALFAVIDLPETATLVNMQTGRNLDAKRGYLLFFSNDKKELISMSLQDTLTLIPGVAEAAKTRLNERLLNHLIRYQTTFDQ